MNRLTAGQKFRYERLLVLIERSSANPTRPSEIADLGNYTILRYAFEFLISCGVAVKTIVNIQCGGRVFEYQCIKGLTVDEYVTHLRAISKRTFVEKKPEHITSIKDHKNEHINGVMIVRERHPTRVVRNTKHSISGSSLSMAV